MSVSRPVFHTRLCDLLGIDYPILQSGMGTVAGPELAAAVSNAGGLGILAGFLLTADQILCKAIRTLRRQTDKPFGVNLLLPPEVRPPIPGRRPPLTTPCRPCRPPGPDPSACGPAAELRAPSPAS